MPTDKMTLGSCGHEATGLVGCQQADACLRIGAGKGRYQVAEPQLPKEGHGIGNVDGEVDAGSMLDFEGVPQTAVVVAPGLDREKVTTDPPWQHGAAPTVVAQR